MTLSAPGSLGAMSEHQQEVVSTGVTAVDAVVEQVASLRDRPLEEHAAVFTDAHETLRRALDDVDGDPT